MLKGNSKRIFGNSLSLFWSNNENIGAEVEAFKSAYPARYIRNAFNIMKENYNNNKKR